MTVSAPLPWAKIEYRPDGVYLTVRPGAPAPSMAEAITELLQKGVQGVDYPAVQSAWAAANGTPVKVAPPHGVIPAVPALSLEPYLRTDERDGEVFLTIAANAPSISERDLITWLNKKDYSGLDLDLVKMAHGGPRGVQFQITRSQNAAQRVVEPKLAEARSILVADADETYRTKVAEGLQRRGLQVRTARYPEAALFEVRQRAIDIVLLAHPFGKEDGLKLAQALRSDPRAASLAVLAVCAQPTREVVKRALDCGVSDILVRPWPPGALFHKMDSALRRVGKKLPAVPGDARDAESRPPGEDMKTLGKIDVAKLVAAVSRLHALPGVVERVLSLTSDPDTGARELAECIQSDPAVAAVVLRMANSAMYGSSGKIASVSEAVVRIGFLQTKSLVVGMSVIKNFSKGMKSAGFDRVLFWRHSISVAIIAKLIADSIRMGNSEVAFVAGLLHDIGKLLLDEFVPMEFSQAVMAAIERRVPLIEAEPRVLQTSHVEVGPAVLAVWRFPEGVITAVKNHHAPIADPNSVPTPVRELCDVVFVANRLAKATGHGHGGDLAIEEVPDAVWVRLGLRGGLPENFWKRFRIEAERFESLLGFDSTPLPEFGTSAETVFLHDARAPRVSLLSLALESAGYKVRTGREASEAGGGAKFSCAVARGETPDTLATTLHTWSGVPSLAGARHAGILPRGGVVPQGQAILAEPYDRSALLELLSPPSAKPQA